MKKLHPIRKMDRAIDKCVTHVGIERAIAEGVKPLLDALEAQLEGHRRVSSGGCRCDRCRLLAAWKEPL